MGQTGEYSFGVLARAERTRHAVYRGRSSRVDRARVSPRSVALRARPSLLFVVRTQIMLLSLSAHCTLCPFLA